MNKTNLIARQQANIIELYFYDDIESDSFDWWTGKTIESETSAKYLQKVLDENPQATNINLYINSYGGEVKEGIAIYNILKRAKQFVTVYVDGFACSIASVIAMAGQKVIMGPNTLMMIHNAWTFACGNAAQLRKAADDVEVINEASTTSYLEKCGDKLTKEKLVEMLEAETWLTAQMCLEFGFCDEVKTEQKTTIEDAQQKFEQAKQQAMKGSIPQQKVPAQFEKQKNIAEQLMSALKKKEV